MARYGINDETKQTIKMARSALFVASEFVDTAYALDSATAEADALRKLQDARRYVDEAVKAVAKMQARRQRRIEAEAALRERTRQTVAAGGTVRRYVTD